jgi:hypothetical protein
MIECATGSPEKKERARKEGETWLSQEEERCSFHLHASIMVKKWKERQETSEYFFYYLSLWKSSSFERSYGSQQCFFGEKFLRPIYTPLRLGVTPW